MSPSSAARGESRAAVTPSRPLSRELARRVLRLRGTAFDHYDGRKWTRSAGDSIRMTPIGEYCPLKRMPRDGDLTLKLVLDHLDEPVLLLRCGPSGTIAEINATPLK